MPPVKTFENEARFATTKQHEKAISKMMKSNGLARRSDAARAIFEAGVQALYNVENGAVNNAPVKHQLNGAVIHGNATFADNVESKSTRSKR